MKPKVTRFRSPPRAASAAATAPTLIAALLLLLLFTSIASGESLAVRLVAPGGSDSGDCLAAPCATLAYALGQAAPGDTISLAAGTYTEPGVTVDKNVTITGAGQNNTYLQPASGPSLAATRVMTVTSNLQVTIQDLTLRYGNLGFRAESGAGIWNQSGTALSLQRVTLTENYGSQALGGAIHNAGRLQVENSSLSSNAAYTGGGIDSSGPLTLTFSLLEGNYAYQGGGFYAAGDLTLLNSTLISNTAENRGGGGYVAFSSGLISGTLFSDNLAQYSSGRGGGLYNNFGKLTLANTNWLNNHASDSGGGFYNNTEGQLSVEANSLAGNTADQQGGAVSNLGMLTLSNSTLEDNLAGDSLSGDAGGLFNQGSAQVVRSTLSGNQAGDYGGGILNQGQLTLSKSTLSANQAAQGGGLYNEDIPGNPQADIVNSTFSANYAAGFGGAIYNGNVANLYNTTIYSSTANTNGMAIENAGNMLLRNTIVAEASSPNSLASLCTLLPGGSFSGQNNLLDEPCGAAGSLGYATKIDPLLKNNGGATQTHALLAGSNAIDRGLNNCVGPAGALTTDQRDLARPVDGNSDGLALCDIGTFEAPTYAPIDLVATAIEVTQAVQDLNNSVRLVADKPTFVRFHVYSADGDHVTTAQLTVTNLAGDQQTLLPVNSGGPDLTVLEKPDRKVLDHAFLFELPANFLHGSIGLFAELNPGPPSRQRDPIETNYNNNDLAIDISFETVPILELIVYRYQYISGGLVETNQSDVNQMVDWLERAFPTPNVIYFTRTFFSPPLLSLPNCNMVNAEMIFMKVWDFIFNPWVPFGARYVGMIDDNSGANFMRGCAPIGGLTAASPTGSTLFSWDTDGSYGDWYGGHELAHSYGRSHANFCGAIGGLAYPYSGGRISPTTSGNSALYGFDISTWAIYPPTSKDVMTYCSNLWLSDFTYENLMTFFQTHPVSLAARPDQGQAVDRLLVSGSLVPATGQADLRPLFIIPNAPDVLPRKAGPFTILLQDANGDELARYPFTPSRSEPDLNPGGQVPQAGVPQAEPPSLLFHELVPYVDGTARVEVRGPSGGLIKAVEAGAAPPEVTLLTPNGGSLLAGDAITVTWSASDPDGDDLHFMLQYSADDGATWQVVAQNLQGDSVAVGRQSLSASKSARFRVWVSDGIHTASDASDGPSIVPNRPPLVRILRPKQNISVVISQTVGLQGRAFDVDSGLLSGDQLQWSSSLDGPLGSGAYLPVSDLSLGNHTITLQAMDEQGAVVSDTVRVRVVESASRLPSPPEGLVPGPAQISLNSVDATQARLFLSNPNRLKRALHWQASTDDAWIHLSQTSGLTPDELQVSLVADGLAPGDHHGLITLTSPDLPEVKVQVPVSVYIENYHQFLPLLVH